MTSRIERTPRDQREETVYAEPETPGRRHPVREGLEEVVIGQLRPPRRPRHVPWPAVRSAAAAPRDRSAPSRSGRSPLRRRSRSACSVKSLIDRWSFASGETSFGNPTTNVGSTIVFSPWLSKISASTLPGPHSSRSGPRDAWRHPCSAPIVLGIPGRPQILAGVFSRSPRTSSMRSNGGPRSIVAAVELELV